MFWIVAYIVLTVIAIYFANVEGVFTSVDSVMVKFTRIVFLLLIGWLIVLLMGIGAIVVGIGLYVAGQTVGYRLDYDFYIIDWIGRQIKKIIPKRKKKEEADTCSKNSPKDP